MTERLADLGFKATAALSGDDDVEAAAKLASTAARVGLRATSTARAAGKAIRDAVEGDAVQVDRTREVSSKEDPIAAVVNAAAREPTNHSLQTIAASLSTGFQKRRAELDSKPVDPNDGLAKAAAAVTGTALTVLKTGTELATTMVPPMPAVVAIQIERVAIGGRFTVAKLTGADVVSIMKRFEKWHGFFQGMSKQAALKTCLGRMRKVPDLDVFNVLDSFSNHNKERMKALSAIMEAILDMRLDAATVKGILGGFNRINNTSDYEARLDALALIAPKLKDRLEAAQVVKDFADESHDDYSARRYSALKVLAKTYSGLTVAEVCSFLAAFPGGAGDTGDRYRASTLLRKRLLPGEDNALIKAMFESPPPLEKAYPETARAVEKLGGFTRGFMGALRGTSGN